MAKNKLFFSQSWYDAGTLRVLTTIIRNWPDRDDSITIGVNKDNEGFQKYNTLRSESVEIWPIPIKSKRDKLNVVEKLFFPKIIKAALKIFLSKIELLSFFRDVLYLRREIKKRKFDVVVSHNGGYPGGELCLRIVVGARLAGVKKIILVIHNYPQPRNTIISKFSRFLLDRIISYSCSSIVSVSKHCAESLYQECSFNKKIDFIYNAIEPVRETKTLRQKREMLGIRENEKIIGVVGNLEKRKGHRYLILAMKDVIKEFPYARLIIIGRDIERVKSELENLIEKNNLRKNITIMGYIRNAAQYSECFDIAVVPSIAYESFGLTCLEAMYYKKPVVGTTIGGLPEVIKDGETGFIVPAMNESELAKKIIYLLSHPEKARRMGENGKKRLESVFSINRVMWEHFSMTN